MAEVEKPDWQQAKPLGEITCSSHDCEQDLHCFRRKMPSDDSYRNGRCVACDIDLIDWDRLDKHDLADADHTVDALQREMIRHVYWHIEIDQRAINHARRKGAVVLRADVPKIIGNNLGLPSKELFRDGSQTPLDGNIIYYAQHATATCCRKCAEEWHAIDKDRTLTEDEVGYMSDLVRLYIHRKLPDLKDEGEYVPPIRTKAK